MSFELDPDERHAGVKTEDKIFYAILILMVLSITAYVIYSEKKINESAQTITPPPTTTIISANSTTTSISVATTSVATSTIQAGYPSTSTSSVIVLPPTTTLIASTTMTPVLPSQNITVLSTIPSKYAGMGYRKATMEIIFLCPSCIPAVQRVLRDTPGVISLNIAYKQGINYVIYDPNKVSLEEVFQKATANGEGRLISDEEV